MYKRQAYTTDEAMGNVWSLVAFTKDAFKEKFGDADLATVIGVESYVLGSDSDYIYPVSYTHLRKAGRSAMTSGINSRRTSQHAHPDHPYRHYEY